MIIISHPHFYTTWADWSTTFNCPVYMSKADSSWANRASDPKADLKLLTEMHTEISRGVTAVRCGGHFDGSMVLHWDGMLFVADTLFTIAVGAFVLTLGPPYPTNQLIDELIC
jgi:glyoxylase-like metal-dependent hydrolase (beta-lactamase superfamily II)